MNDRKLIDASGAPAAVGPYSHAVRHGSVLYCSGMLPLDPGTGETVEKDVATEVEQCLNNLAAVCEAAGTDLGATLRATIYTTRLELFDQINTAYAAFFSASPPARAAIGVAALPKGVQVEIDAIVAVG
jgi:2-iminobutanoate/2-iminopropanoate deaminase